jgi:hypothetical protein
MNVTPEKEQKKAALVALVQGTTLQDSTTPTWLTIRKISRIGLLRSSSGFTHMHRAPAGLLH